MLGRNAKGEQKVNEVRIWATDELETRMSGKVENSRGKTEGRRGTKK